MINPLQTATVCQCTEEGDYAVYLAHRNKVKMYQALCTKAGMAFSPLAVDTYVGWHKEALAVITRLGTQQAQNLDKEPGKQIRFLRQRLGISLSNDCSQMLATRVPAYAPEHVDGTVDTD